jgi:sugar (pentulose or hexulose) kinase
MEKKSNDGYLLALDGGTGTVRAVLFNLEGDLIHQEVRPRIYGPDPLGGEFLQVFDAKAFWSEICLLIRTILHDAGIPAESVLAVSATGQRFSYVFLGDRDEVLYAGPNLDGRGAYLQGDIEDRLGMQYYLLTGQWPPLTSALARFLWFQREAPAIFSRIRTVLMFNDWMLYKLCGEKHTEVTAASASGLLDVRARSWSGIIRNAFEIDASLLPPIARAGETIGRVLPQAAEETGLKPGTPVVVGGADTQCALLGGGVWGADQVGIAAGTTAPVCRVMDSPYVDPEKRVWTSCHLESAGWILEANTPWAGYVLQWARDILARTAERSCMSVDIYGWMEEQASQTPPGAGDTFGFVGPAIMVERNFQLIRPAIFFFPPPAHPVTESPAHVGHFLRAILENIVFAIRANYEQILSIKVSEFAPIHLTGGLAKSRLFCQMISDCLDLPVVVARIREGSALGAAICGAVGIGTFSDLAAAQKALVQKDSLFEPNEENASLYQAAYERWRAIYEKIEAL